MRRPQALARQLERRPHRSAERGTAYYSLLVDGDLNPDAVWYYAEPKEAASEIKGGWHFGRECRSGPRLDVGGREQTKRPSVDLHLDHGDPRGDTAGEVRS